MPTATPSATASPAAPAAGLVFGPLIWALLGALLVIGAVAVLMWRWRVAKTRWEDAQRSARNPQGMEANVDIVEKGKPRSPQPPTPPSEPQKPA